MQDSQFSLAIGKQGQNVRLANKLCDWAIDVKTEEQAAELDLTEADSRKAAETLFAEQPEQEEYEEVTAVSQLPGVDARVADLLKASGMDDIEAFIAASKDGRLLEIEGLTKEEETELKMVFTHGKKRNAIANAVIKEGKGTITINRIPIHNIEPKPLRIKIFEPILVLGVDKFKNLNIKVRVTGGGPVAQLYAARTAIAKGIVAWNQKYVDEESKDEARRDLLNYDKNLLVADYRRLEPKKYGGPGARSRKQKSYR